MALCLMLFNVMSQQESNLVFDVQSKYNTDVEIDITVKYDGEFNYSLKDILIKRINSIIIDSLMQYDALEMHTTARNDMNRIINNAYKQGLAKKQITFYELTLNDIKIPEELRLLYEKLKELEQ